MPIRPRAVQPFILLAYLDTSLTFLGVRAQHSSLGTLRSISEVLVPGFAGREAQTLTLFGCASFRDAI